MKAVLFTCLGLVLAIGLNCSIDKRSGAFACTTNADCGDGRVCMDSFCVVETGSNPQMIDAARGSGSGSGSGSGHGSGSGSGSGNMCPATCTSCGSNGSGERTCDIDCSQKNCTNGTITCPTGFACTIMCSQNNDCPTVNCSTAAACAVTCSGDSSCEQVTCGSGACDVTCSGKDACHTDVNCGSACACTVECNIQNQACQQSTITCPISTVTGMACSAGIGCTSSTTFPGCNSCP